MTFALLPLLLLRAQQPAPPPAPNFDEAELQMRRFVQAFAVIEENAAEKVNPDQAFYGGALPAMLRTPR